jgi:membrane protease YdiL (CAAX protease family)
VLSEKPWKLESLLWLGMGLLLSMAVGNAAAALLRHGDEESFAALVVGTLSFQGALLVLVGVFLRSHQMSWNEAFGFGAPHSDRAVWLAFLVTLLALPVTWTLQILSALVMTWVHLDLVTQKVVTTVQQTVEVGPRVYLAFMAIVLAPLAEELLFRGLVYPFLKTVLGRHSFPGLAAWFRARLYPWVLGRLGRRPAFWVRAQLCHGLRQPWPVAAALVTSVLFGAIHFNLMTLLPLILLSLALVWLYEVTGNLLAPILAHSLFNLANFFLLMTVPING